MMRRMANDILKVCGRYMKNACLGGRLLLTTPKHLIRFLMFSTTICTMMSAVSAKEEYACRDASSEIARLKEEIEGLRVILSQIAGPVHGETRRNYEALDENGRKLHTWIEERYDRQFNSWLPYKKCYDTGNDCSWTNEHGDLHFFEVQKRHTKPCAKI